MQSRFGSPRASYQTIDLNSRIEGASPHKLVGILFEELLKGLDAMIVAAERRDTAQLALRQSRALSVLGGLHGSLDMEKGGEIAASLASIYREARRLALKGGKECNPAPIGQARAMLAEIAVAWDSIA